VRFGVLGPLEVTASGSGEPLPAPRAPKIRVVLATLLLRSNSCVPASTLIDELWEDPPRTATTTLQVYISQLRKTLRRADPGERRVSVVTRRPGYLLRLDPGGLDLTAFEDLSARGTAALQRREFAAAADAQRQALALWRGPLLCDVPHGSLLRGAAVRMADLRLSALEQRVRADLHLGRHQELVGELQQLANDHPTREQIHAHLMVALYRAGRQADALRAFARLAGNLGDELGISPGRQLQRLHRRIRADDTALLRPAGARPAAAAVRLPSPDPLFGGRADVLASVVDGLLEAASGEGPVALTGPAGMGKTALAVAAAHRTAPLFPDGRVLIRLRSAAGAARDPAEVLDEIKRHGGAPAAGTPDRPGRPGEPPHGRRGLVVLDDAAPEQLPDLLPALAGAAVLITARALPPGLPVGRSIALHEPGAAQARDLLAAAAGVTGEDPALDEIVELCGALPSALRAAAELLTEGSSGGPAGLAALLREGPARLGLVGRGPRAAYDRAAAADRRAFRLLGLVPSGPVTAGVAAAVLDTDTGEAVATAESLLAAGLLDRDQARGHWLQPPLFRLLARERLAEEETPRTVRAALARLCAGYTAQLPRRWPPEDLARERPALVETVARAHAAGLWRETVRLAEGLGAALEAPAAWDDWERTHLQALDAARRLGDRAAQARLARSLRDLAWQRCRLARAHEVYERARAAPDRTELARILSGLAERRRTAARRRAALLPGPDRAGPDLEPHHLGGAALGIGDEQHVPAGRHP
jgi:DNA-binding SARP family transcriptional activator